MCRGRLTPARVYYADVSSTNINAYGRPYAGEESAERGSTSGRVPGVAPNQDPVAIEAFSDEFGTEDRRGLRQRSQRHSRITETFLHVLQLARPRHCPERRTNGIE